MENKQTKCAIFLANGFEECEALITVDLLRRADIQIDMISMNQDLKVTSSHNITVLADQLYQDTEPENYDVLILPGGKVGTANLNACDSLKKSLRVHMEEGRLTAAICAAPSILGGMGLLRDRNYTCFPTFDSPEFGGTYQMVLAVSDGNLITGRGMGATVEFAREILKKLISEEDLEKVENSIQYEHRLQQMQ